MDSVRKALPNTPCGWTANNGRSVCASVARGEFAVHVLNFSLPVAPAGTALCAFHSPYDVKATDAPAIEPDTYNVRINDDQTNQDMHGLTWGEVSALVACAVHPAWVEPGCQGCTEHGEILRSLSVLGAYSHIRNVWSEYSQDFIIEAFSIEREI